MIIFVENSCYVVSENKSREINNIDLNLSVNTLNLKFLKNYDIFKTNI